MKRILLLSVIACALTTAPLYARPNGNSRSAPAHVQRSTITRVTPSPGNRFATARNFTNARNFSSVRNVNRVRNFQTTRNWNAGRNFNTVRNFNHRHRTRIVYVNYGSPWYGFGCGWPYYDSYYPYYYGYGPSVSFNFGTDGYAYDPYMYNYGGGSNYYSNGYSNGYYSNNAQPESRDGSYNVGNASIVSKVQERLSRDGYYKGAIDGSLGSRTHYAIRAYQRDHGLDANGTVTEELLRTMGLR